MPKVRKRGKRNKEFKDRKEKTVRKEEIHETKYRRHQRLICLNQDFFSC